ncbi:hypothetical protein [Halopseudomonas sabulinigri]|uniref:Uncharacterized protein n=1 Tax=Halopseudomonas sabulinigri TaxID=472181 RepID=A0ABP9ZUD5_9GAMM
MRKSLICNDKAVGLVSCYALRKTVIPASTSKLKPGDVCFIPRSDGGYVPFAFLCAPAKKRSSFYGGILNVVVASPSVEELPASVEVKEYSLVNISCFRENNTPILGNAAPNIGETVLASILRETTDFSVGTRSRVWGYRTILKYAEAVVA